jgi:hypothetical protein
MTLLPRLLLSRTEFARSRRHPIRDRAATTVQPRPLWVISGSGHVSYSFINFSISSKNWNRGFSNNTKCVAFGISTLFLTGACSKVTHEALAILGKDHVSNARNHKRWCINIRCVPEAGQLLDKMNPRVPFGARKLAGVRELLVGSVAMYSFQNSIGTAGSR